MLDLLDAALPAPASGVFTTRSGGTSRGPWDALDLAHHVGDDGQHVSANRELLAEALGLSAHDVAYMAQPHGNGVAVVGRPIPLAQAAGVHGVDGLVTRSKGVGLAVLAADCLPVLLADPRAGVIAAAHAGRQGLVTGVLQEVLRVMAEHGARPAHTTAVIGPAVCGRCYELPQQVVEQVEAAVPGTAARTRQDTPSADLTAGALQLLDRAGVGAASALGGCTLEQPQRFYSHRRDGRTGRHAGLVVLR